MSKLARWSEIVGVEISPLSPRQKTEAYKGRFVLPDGTEACLSEVVQFDAFIFREAELVTREMPTLRGSRAHISRLQGSFQREAVNLREPLVLLRLKGEPGGAWSYFEFDLSVEVSCWGAP